MSGKSKPWGNLLRVVCFLLLFALLFQWVSDVLRPVRHPGGEFRREPANTLDVLFCGSSRMLNGVSPLRLYEHYGIPSYNLGQNGQVLSVTYYVLLDALTRQKPKVVVLDVYKVIHDTVYGTEGDLHVSMDDVPLGPAKVRSALDLLSPEYRAEFLADIIVYHSRWKELTPESFNTPNGVEKGAQALYGLCQLPEGWSIIPEEQTSPPVALQLEYLEKIVRLCQDRGIEVLLISLPFSTPPDDDLNRQAVINSIAASAERWGVPFINFMYRLDELNFDFTEDMHDVYHLNYKGMDKATLWLGEYLRSQYGLPDRRGEGAYGDWDEAAAGYDAYLAGQIAAHNSPLGAPEKEPGKNCSIVSK